MTFAETTLLRRLYTIRPCWICAALAWCGHREPAVDLAEMKHEREKGNQSVLHD